MNIATMNRLKAVMIVLAVSAPAGAMAQGRNRDTIQDRTRDRTAIQDQAADRDRVTDRDRIQDRDQDRATERDRDRDQTRDQDRTQDRDRTRDPLYLQDRQQLRDRDIYGAQLMTRKELREYRDQLASKNSVREWAQLRAQHQEQMMARARERNVQLALPFYGQQLMTHQERIQLQTRLQKAANEQERERIREEHRKQMQERAREYQIPLNELGEG